jgi:hypothetical protein
MALPTASDNAFPSLLVTEGSAPSSPAAGKQRVYIDSSDHHLKTKTSGGTVQDYFPVAGGGGGGIGEYASKYNPDHETPSTAVALQEEFNTTTGMAWTSAPGTDDLTSYPGYYRIKGNNTERHLSKAWTPGATDITVACKLSYALGTTAAGGIGLYVGSATGNPADAVYCLMEASSSGNNIFSLYNENSSSFALIGASVTIEAAPIMRQQIYLRLTRVNSGPTWTAYASLDGVTWEAVATTGSKALTIGAFGLRLDNNHDIRLDWIRCWASVVEKVGA